MNTYLILILAILIGDYVLNLVLEVLNVKNASPILPKEFEGYYDAAKYKTSQNYLKENTKFTLISDAVFKLILIIFILKGGFNFVDIMARSFNLGSIGSGLVFSVILLLLAQIINLPFSIYNTFVIEEKYGFNRTTPLTFVSDLFKTWILAVIIGGIALAAILWFFEKMGSLAWVYCWLFLSLFQIFLLFIAPAVILPLFNKFIPLEEGELRRKIEDYAKAQSFKLKGIFKMDGSKRSTKSNAFFTGFGKYKRIALFDTLIERQSVDELVSVLAHEVGHYKKHHVLKGVVMALITSAFMFFILSLFINNPKLFSAFKMENISIYASLFFFSFLYSPVNMLISIYRQVLSRKHEYEADAYAVETYKQPEAMILALKKLSVDNLSNLTPHPLKVFLEYSHPPVLKRIEVIRKLAV